MPTQRVITSADTTADDDSVVAGVLADLAWGASLTHATAQGISLAAQVIQRPGALASKIFEQP